MNKKKKWKNISNNNTLKNLKINYLKEFKNKNEFYELIFYIKGWTKSDCIIHELDTFGIEEEKKFILMFEELKTKPFQYIVNEAYFFGYNFYVDNRVLIPRRETELIVENIIDDEKDYPIYADVCTGSGCIAASLMKYKEIKKCYALDISKEALEVAKLNFDKLGLDIEILKGDFLNPLIDNNIRVNLLTINPPYISFDDEYVEDKVRDNEPHIALFSDDKGLKFYETLFLNINKVMILDKKFKIICEFGFKQKDDIKLLFLKSGLKYKIDFYKDHSGNWRYFTITN